MLDLNTLWRRVDILKPLLLYLKEKSPSTHRVLHWLQSLSEGEEKNILPLLGNEPQPSTPKL
jgi:hypothetical protein